MAELADHGPLPQHDLADRLRLEKSTVSRLVSQLERRGWVVRHRRATDGRVRWLELTAEGRTAAQRLATARAARFTALLAAIPESNRTAVLDSLQILWEASDAVHRRD